MIFPRKSLIFLLVLATSGCKSKAFAPSLLITSSFSSRAAAFPHSSLYYQKNENENRAAASSLAMNSSTMDPPTTSSIPSWKEISSTLSLTPVGKALDDEVQKREKGLGAPHVHNQLRMFDFKSTPQITLYRDHAGWCPYCQKTMLLVEEKQIPLKIELVNMRSYGDKPNEFLRKVPGGLLPALEVNGQVITESAVIMQLLDEWYSAEDGYKRMVPDQTKEPSQYKQYQYLMRLERELFSWWCTFMFRPESGGGGLGGALSGLMGGTNSGGGGTSPQMQGFLDCLQQVNDALQESKGPFFLDFVSNPTMIDFVFASHVERMLASCAYWKGMDLRSPKQYPQLGALQEWMNALEKAEYYLAFKSDYYTHVKDIPPQYGPSYDGIAFPKRIQEYQAMILGQDGKSWALPLEHDDPLQPLYRGPPLPLCVLEANQITADADGSYSSSDPSTMAVACRQMAAWKLAGNGPKISIFSSRGGPKGARNPRKTFGAELADPYAESDADVVHAVDAALRITGLALQDVEDHAGKDLPSSKYTEWLKDSVPSQQVEGVVASLEYLRDRIGVPRDLPLASARYLRAYLNWAIGTLQQ